MEKLKIYAKSILIPVIIGGIVGILISNYIDYDSLIKPFLAPPSIVFPIMWTILYILMGISYGILKSKNLLNSEIKWIYYLQLFVNAMWPIIFFIWKWRFLAFLWIILLDVLVIILIIKFYHRHCFLFRKAENPAVTLHDRTYALNAFISFIKIHINLAWSSLCSQRHTCMQGIFQSVR